MTDRGRHTRRLTARRNPGTESPVARRHGLTAVPSETPLTFAPPTAPHETTAPHEMTAPQGATASGGATAARGITAFTEVTASTRTDAPAVETTGAGIRYGRRWA